MIDLHQTWFKAENLKTGMLAEINDQLCYIHGIIQDYKDNTVCIKFYQLSHPDVKDYCYLTSLTNVRVWLKY